MDLLENRRRKLDNSLNVFDVSKVTKRTLCVSCQAILTSRFFEDEALPDASRECKWDRAGSSFMESGQDECPFCMFIYTQLQLRTPMLEINKLNIELLWLWGIDDRIRHTEVSVIVRSGLDSSQVNTHFILIADPDPFSITLGKRTSVSALQDDA